MIDRLKLFRNKAGLSQKELANKAEVSRVYINQLESGRSHKPSGQVVYRLAEALDIKMEDFYKPLN